MLSVLNEHSKKTTTILLDERFVDSLTELKLYLDWCKEQQTIDSYVGYSAGTKFVSSAALQARAPSSPLPRTLGAADSNTALLAQMAMFDLTSLSTTVIDDSGLNEQIAFLHLMRAALNEERQQYLVSSLLLASYLMDDSYYHMLISEIVAKLSKFMQEIKALPQHLQEDIFLQLPYQLIPEQLQSDNNFMTRWFNYDHKKLLVIEGKTYCVKKSMSSFPLLDGFGFGDIGRDRLEERLGIYLYQTESGSIKPDIRKLSETRSSILENYQQSMSERGHPYIRGLYVAYYPGSRRVAIRAQHDYTGSRTGHSSYYYDYPGSPLAYECYHDNGYLEWQRNFVATAATASTNNNSSSSNTEQIVSVLLSKSKFKLGVLHDDDYTEYYPDGQNRLRCTGVYKNGSVTGQWTYYCSYHSNGQVKSKVVANIDADRIKQKSVIDYDIDGNVIASETDEVNISLYFHGEDEDDVDIVNNDDDFGLLAMMT